MTSDGTTDANRSFEEHLAEVLDRAYCMAFNLARNAADAEDLIQDAALRAFRAFETFAVGTNFKAWFMRVLINCHFTRRRNEQRRPKVLGFEPAEEDGALFLYRRTADEGWHERTEDPAQVLLSKMSVEQVAEAMHALPEEYRVVTVLFFLEELSYEEIAETLGCRAGTVRSRLHRGRKLLQRKLWSVARDEGILAAVSAEVMA